MTPATTRRPHRGGRQGASAERPRLEVQGRLLFLPQAPVSLVHTLDEKGATAMKKRGYWAAVLAALALLAPPVAGSANETSVENCGGTVDRQFENGVTAGGGPKSGVINEESGLPEVPTNCDQFWQFIGAIGPG
jgi:hypothetical protein